MKNLFTLFIAFFSLVLLNSCREDGSWEDSSERYRFTIDRDNDFTEKGIGEKTLLKYNINPSYKFEVFEMKFKYTSNLNGDLFLDGKLLEQNKEYTLKNQNNIFEYVGKVSGIHKLKLIATNSKKYTKTEEFELKYGVADFSHNFEGGIGDIYQSDPTVYTMKIVPKEGNPKSGYQIKFNSYNGTIKLNGVDAQLGQYYPLPNIDNFTTTLSTNHKGQGKLTYSIKNPTVEKDYEIQQNVLARKIAIESMNISTVNTTPNNSLSIIGVVKKIPITGNNNVQYKTWISSASNNNTSGIQNTNNVYTPYILGANGSFSYNFKAIAAGTYTYNIQLKDEFGNESDVKTYNVTVENNITIVTPPSASVTLHRTARNLDDKWGNYDIRHLYKGTILNLIAKASTGNGISKVVFDLNFNYEGKVINKRYTYNYDNFPAKIDFGNTNTNENEQLGRWINRPNKHMINASNGTFTCYIYDKFNNIITEKGTTIVNVIQ